MKRIILTEYQYKRLIKKNLNEQKIVFSNPKDEFDITNQMMQLLIHLEFFIDTIANKFLYIDKVENGIIYIDSVKYTKEEKDLINTEIDKWIVFTDSTRDKRSQDLTYNFGVDTDWDDRYPNEDIAVVDNDNSDVTDDVDFEDDSTTEIDYDPTKKYSRTEYIALVKDNAIKQMKKHKIPASITIAQGIIESGDGNSGLARKGKNHFGIKCHSWTGEKIYLDTGEVNKDGSKRIDKNACFRKYDNISQSFDDHSKFLIDNSRYSSLFELGTTNYKGWAEGLQKAGYATSPTYANLVISIIEKNNLNKFDSNTNSLVVGCTFTSAELKYFNENIKNNEDNLNFRYWVNQDSNRLERVNKKLSDCGLSNPILDKQGSINDYLRHSFVLIGKDWVNAGKPKRPEDVETEIPKKVVKTNCELTTEEIEFFNKHIKNDEDNLNFRYWVNQDSIRLKKVNKKLSDCGLSDPNLSKKGSINDYLRHSFVLIGKDWVNAGKPKRPKEEVVDDDVIYDSNELLTWSERAKKDRDNGIINPILISDIIKALKAINMRAQISWARTGHSKYTDSGSISRHWTGNAVDISVIEGIGNPKGKSSNKGIGNANFMKNGDRLVAELQKMGYTFGERGKTKGYLWRTNEGGNHWNHVHVSNKDRKKKVETEIPKKSEEPKKSETKGKKLPPKVQKLMDKLKSKWGVVITQSHIDKEYEMEGDVRSDAGSVNTTAENKIKELIKDCKKAYPNVNYPADIKSGYRSYDTQVDNFGKKVKTDGRSIENVQASNCLPGFTQHHTGRAFDIFSVDTSWWDKNPKVKKWVADNCKKYGFKVTYTKPNQLRIPEPWHLFYIG
jgi:flagellum-specific peptidoglycan hydrolase FlgJ/LAS superfamily LD-carboxypeptidase LdcB